MQTPKIFEDDESTLIVHTDNDNDYQKNTENSSLMNLFVYVNFCYMNTYLKLNYKLADNEASVQQKKQQSFFCLCALLHTPFFCQFPILSSFTEFANLAFSKHSVFMNIELGDRKEFVLISEISKINKLEMVKKSGWI